MDLKIKIANDYYKKDKDRLSKKRLVKGSKIFLQKKNTKSANIARGRYINYRNLSEKENDEKR